MTPEIDIEKLRAGDHDALQQVYAELAPRLSVFVRARYGDYGASEAEDIVQDTLVMVLTRLHLFKGDSAEEFLRWCFLIARNKVMDSFRRRTALARCDKLVEAELPAAREPQEDIEVTEVLLRAIEHLPERERIILKMRLDGLSYQDCAERLGCSVNTLHTLYFRTIKKLQEQLKRDGVTE